MNEHREQIEFVRKGVEAIGGSMGRVMFGMGSLKYKSMVIVICIYIATNSNCISAASTRQKDPALCPSVHFGISIGGGQTVSWLASDSYRSDSNNKAV